MRCFLHLGMTTVEPYRPPGAENDLNVCKITSYLHLDPRGMIPSFVVNMTMGMGMESMEAMRRWMQQHYNEYCPPAILKATSKA